MSNNPFVLFLVGPTAVGKSDIAVALAKKIGGEIVSCDSMQVYRGMDIGTAKPSRAVQRRVPHHLIDIVRPDKSFNVSLYRAKAMRVLRDILRRKKIPIVVGGTGLYFKALLDGLFEGPGADNKYRAMLEREVEKKGSPWLYDELYRVDPEAAKKVHPNNVRRVIRALEVHHLAGKTMSELQRECSPSWPSPARGEGTNHFPYPFLAIGLEMDRPELYRRVDKRVIRMFRQGLKKEVQRLLAQGLGKNEIAAQAIGYKEIIGWLNGAYDRKTALALVQRNSRRFAKRQYTWFKKDARIHWIKVEQNARRAEIVEVIARLLRLRFAMTRDRRSISSDVDHQN